MDYDAIAYPIVEFLEKYDGVLVVSRSVRVGFAGRQVWTSIIEYLAGDIGLKGNDIQV